MVTRAVYHLNQANDKWEDNEKCIIKIEMGASTANQDANSTTANEGVMYDQVMTSQETGAATVGAGMRKSEDVYVLLESNKKCTRARMNAIDVWVSIKWKEDNGKRTTKTKTGASTANQDANSTSANEGGMTRRSKRLNKSMNNFSREQRSCS